MKIGLKIAVIICFMLGVTIAILIMWENEHIQEGEVWKKDEKPVIVIDAGHGGFDGGASGTDGTLEMDLNLEISRRLESVAAEYPVHVIMTRKDEKALAGTKTEDMRRRKEIMEDVNADICISIHMNSFSQDPSVKGPQVFYPRGDERSKTYAEAVQSSMERLTEDGNIRQVMEKDNVYLMKNTVCPLILVECGFLSNGEELTNLKSENYQRKVAEAIWEGVNVILDLKKIETIPVIDSKNIPDFVCP